MVPMKLIKRVLLIILVIVGIGLGVRITMQHIPTESLNGSLDFNALQNAARITEFKNSASETLSQKLPALQGSVLGVEQQSTSAEPSLVQKTAEYALYSYCKQIVQEYENKTPQN